MPSSNPTIFIVGAGRVATALAGGLRLTGAPILGLWSRRAEASREASNITGVVSFGAAPPDALLDAEAVILAVKDDAIASIAKRLVDTGLVGKRHVLLHCSGSQSARDVLGDVAEQVAAVGTMHPLKAIASGRNAMNEWPGTIFGVEGDDEAIDVAKSLARKLACGVLPLTADQMAAYHASAAIASNLVVALLAASGDVLVGAGMDADNANAALVKLARSALDQVEARGMPDGLTGPIRRGDATTIEKHLQALTDYPLIRDMYRIVSSKALHLSREIADADPSQLQAIEQLLQN